LADEKGDCGVTDHLQSWWLGFFRHSRKKTKARHCLNRCGCNRVQHFAIAGFENTQSDKDLYWFIKYIPRLFKCDHIPN